MWTDHPDDEALFHAEPSALAHARECPPCAVRASRLRAGSALVQRARRASQPDLDWDRLDRAVHEAADRAASEVRAARTRPTQSPRRPIAWAAGTLAVAAAATLAIRASVIGPTNSRAPGPVVDPRPTLARVHGGEAPLPPSPAWDAARVLLATADVTHQIDRGEEAPLREDTRVRRGERVRAREASGRALLATAVGQRVELRGPGEVRIAGLDSVGSEAELTAGEARMDVAPSGGKLSLRARGWRVVLKRGAVLAKIEGERLRIRALEGLIDVAHGDGSPTVIAPGREVLLDKEGRSSDVTPSGQEEPRSALRFSDPVDGALRALPAVESGASLSLGDRALPAGTRWLRIDRSVRILASMAGRRWTLALDPRPGARAEVWEPEPPTGTGLLRDGGVTIAQTAPREPTRPRRPPEASPVAPPVARVTLTAATIPPEALIGFRAVQRMLGLRARHCFEACERRQACGDASAIAPVVDLDAQGRVASVRLEGAASPMLAACIEQEVRAMRLPVLSGQRVHLGRFVR